MAITEHMVEDKLMEQLQSFGYEKANINNEEKLITNLKTQLEKHNNTTFSPKEFERILNHLNSGTIFEKAKKLRSKFELCRDNGEIEYIEFFNMADWCKNRYQVAHQITIKGDSTNRYDVTLLINGLPLVQIELKRAGVEIKEAFNQIQRYHEQSFRGTLFDYVQIFVISNKVNTKYFANNPKQSFEQTFYWSDEHNKKITNLYEFCEAFLKPCFLSEMIAKYVVLAQAKQIPMVLRPYQYYAVKRLVEGVKNWSTNGYVWHTTGSGKTLTSFKASELISRMSDVAKVLFVVDRKDLDIQTIKEFNSFSPGSVDGTHNTKNLTKQLKDKNNKLIVTTIQKLDMAIKNERFYKEFAHLQDEKVVLIFDECHRSHFGKTHANIKRFFKNARLFGFTGTPIFEPNSVDGTTTADIFGQSLHRYVITDAIKDANVLGFSVEYIGKYKQKDEDVVLSDIDTQHLHNPQRIQKIANYILQIHDKKTKNRKFNALFATQSTKMAYEYYKAFQKLHHDLKIATIFTFAPNEGVDFEEEQKESEQIAKQKLEKAIQDYNRLFGTNYSTQDFYGYYADVQKRLKRKEIDIAIVVNIMLTGFDSPTLNTLYVDKNLKYHGLIQAYSRTNRLHDSTKPHGNIVCFQDLKHNTDEALELYGNKEAKEVVFQKSYMKQLQEFLSLLQELKEYVPTPYKVDDLASQEDTERFVRLFRELLRKKVSLETFIEFNWKDLTIEEEEFNEYKSKYLDIYEEMRNKNQKDKESTPLAQLDFALELVREDYINYDYIIKLLASIKEQEGKKQYNTYVADFLKKFDTDARLRSKKEYIKRFIEHTLPKIETKEIEKHFDEFWDRQKEEFLQELAQKYHLNSNRLHEIIERYFYTDIFPQSDAIRKLITSKEAYDAIEAKTYFQKKRKLVEVLKEKIKEYVAIFEEW